MSSMDSDPETVKERIKGFMDQGADPLYGSKETGQTLLHLVAAHWDRDIADLVVGKNFNIDVTDKHGRTPLHEAAATNNYEMVEWLIEHQANLEVKTVKECQTPLHYAARYDAMQTIRILLQADGK